MIALTRSQLHVAPRLLWHSINSTFIWLCPQIVLWTLPSITIFHFQIPNLERSKKLFLLDDGHSSMSNCVALVRCSDRGLDCTGPVPGLLRQWTVSRQPARLGIRLGVRRGMGRCHFPIRRLRPAHVRQRIGGSLLQRARRQLGRESLKAT